MTNSSQQVYPTGGVRVFAYPASHYAVADGAAGLRFRVSQSAHGPRADRRRSSNEPARRCSPPRKAHFEPLFATRYIGLTLQIDEGQEVFDAKHSTIHPLFRKP